MKKVYEKPQIVFESFTMTTHIAGDCEPPYVANQEKGSCGIPGSAGDFLFSAKVQGCTTDWEADFGDNYDGFCYHIPTEDKNFFNS